MKSLNKIDQRETLVREIKKELSVLYDQLCNLDSVKLDKPIRHGWYKGLVLRADVERREDSAIYQEVLDTCGRWIWGSDKKYTNRNWDRNVKKNKDWQWAGLAWIRKEEFFKLSDKAKKLFVEYEWKYDPWCGSIKRYYCHVPKHFYITTFKRAYVTHMQVANGIVDKRVAELESQLLSNDLFEFSWIGNGGWMNKWLRKMESRNHRHRSKTALKNYDELNYDRSVGRAMS